LETGISRTDRKGVSGARGLTFALACYASLFAIQLIGYFSTHLLVLLAQSFETLSDVLISSALLFVTYMSAKPPDEEHHFGHERAQNVVAIMSATILIAFFSVETIRRGIAGLLHPPGHIHHGGIAILITAIGMVIVAVPIIVIAREHSDAATTRAQLVSLGRDEVVYILAIIAIVLAINGNDWADAVGSIIVGVMIIFAAVYLIRENYQFLIGRAPDDETLDALMEAAKSVPRVMGVHRLTAEHVGPNTLHVDMHITVKPGTHIEEADEIADEVREKLIPLTGTEYGEIHVEPHTPR
jgi:cation diffusion facilitator family transporter